MGEVVDGAGLGAPRAARLIALAGAALLWHCSNGPDAGDSSDGTGGTTAGGTGGFTATGGAAAPSPAAGSGGNASMSSTGGAGGASAPMASGAGGMFAATGGTGAGGMSAAMSTGGMGAAGMQAMAGSGGSDAMPPGMSSVGCGKADVPPSGDQTIDVDGTQREFIVTVPSAYDANDPHRLIFAWHGLGGTASMIASNYYGLASRAGDSTIFIAAQGLPGTGQQSGFAAWSNTDDGDIAFTRSMLDWAKTNYCVDVERVFSVGMSNGGLMSNLVGCELGDSFRAIAAMSGGGPEGYAMKPCTGQLAVWISHGNMDDNVPFSYGEASRDYWTNANHCGTASMPAMPAECLQYEDCDAGFPVQFCEFDGGHMVPSFAGEAIWSFFAQF